MVNIEKQQAPESLIQYRSAAIRDYGQELENDHIFDNYRNKNELRLSLAEEQGYLCAYCMSRLSQDLSNTKIEHCRSQTDYPSEKLNYTNLLLCCKGNEKKGQKQTDLHCDSKKGGKSFSYNPAELPNNMDKLIQYKRDGRICSIDMDLDNEINTLLNLNYSRLKMNRKNALDSIFIILDSKRGTRTSAEIKRLIRSIGTRDADGKNNPYLGILLYRLRKHPSL